MAVPCLFLAQINAYLVFNSCTFRKLYTRYHVFMRWSKPPSPSPNPPPPARLPTTAPLTQGLHQQTGRLRSIIGSELSRIASNRLLTRSRLQSRFGDKTARSTLSPKRNCTTKTGWRSFPKRGLFKPSRAFIVSEHHTAIDRKPHILSRGQGRYLLFAEDNFSIPVGQYS